MIYKNLVKSIVEEKLESSNLFFVDAKVSKSNVITVIIDGDDGVLIEDCIALSKYIESHLDRDKEDYELTVTSFGLEEYFTMNRQYKKNVGENVEVVMKDGEKFNGILCRVDDEGIVLQSGKKNDEKKISFCDIEKSRVIINI